NPKTPPSGTSRSRPSTDLVGGLRNLRYSLASPETSMTAIESNPTARRWTSCPYSGRGFPRTRVGTVPESMTGPTCEDGGPRGPGAHLPERRSHSWLVIGSREGDPDARDGA